MHQESSKQTICKVGVTDLAFWHSFWQFSHAVIAYCVSEFKCNWFNRVSSIKILLFRNCACCSSVARHSDHPSRNTYSYTDIAGVWGFNLWSSNSHFTQPTSVNTPWWSYSFARTSVRTLSYRLTAEHYIHVLSGSGTIF